MVQNKYFNFESSFEEMMVDKRDVIILLRYLQVPDNDHACEHPKLIDCVDRLTRDFDINVSSCGGALEQSIGVEVIEKRKWDRITASYWAKIN